MLIKFILRDFATPGNMRYTIQSQNGTVHDKKRAAIHFQDLKLQAPVRAEVLL